MSIELKQLMKNYQTKNPQTEPWEQDWCISPLPGKITQVKLILASKKSFDYACRYPVTEGDVAIIGYQLPQYDYDSSACESSANTGQMAVVSEAIPKLTIKRSYTVEVDFIFTHNVIKKNITQCAKYISYGQEDYPSTLQLGKHASGIRPISYQIRRILAAASILAHPKLTAKENLEAAKAVIMKQKRFEPEMAQLAWGPPEYIGVCFNDIHTPNSAAVQALDYEKWGCKEYEWDEGILREACNAMPKILESEQLQKFINKYSHIGAVSIMLRGGFKNLLSAYLSVNPPINAFYDEMCEVLSGIGHEQVYEVLKAYEA